MLTTVITLSHKVGRKTLARGLNGRKEKKRRRIRKKKRLLLLTIQEVTKGLLACKQTPSFVTHFPWLHA